MLIEGLILSRGYLNNREKTVNAFIKGLKWVKDNKSIKYRFYYIKNLVCYNSNSKIIYLGRKDSQIKINNYLIKDNYQVYKFKTA